MNLELSGKVAVVTGASKGIGLAITRGFVAEGGHVIAGARGSSPELDELAAAGSVDVVTVDLAEPDAPARLIAAAGARLDVLVNNVGLALPRTDGFLSVTDQMWQDSLNLNLLSAVRTTRAALPIMIAAGGGVIVNTGSVNARLPDPAVIDYSAAKAALTNLAKSLSKEFGARGIRVNTVAPGPVATDLWLGADGVAARLGKATGLRPEDVAAAAAQGMVTGRFTRPDEVANLVLLLASARSDNITGAEFTIDGGLITTL
jgi:NAD(P)-dependent dehydrogenase (short-subunit alcohol dehydrogenase family)